MTKRISINILAISFIGILLVPITASAHSVGGQNPPDKVHKVIEVLYDLDPEDVHDKVDHNFNNYGNRPHNDPDLCNGYEGGHSGYDVAHEDDDAPFYSLTDGEVINVKHPTNDIKDLSYISIYTSKKTVFYLHPSYIDVRIGQRVEVGDYLGKQGNTGNSTNPHVHLEVRKGRSEPPSCGIAAAERTNRPNEDPIPFLYGLLPEEGNGNGTTNEDSVVSIEPKSIVSLDIGQELEFNLEIEDGVNVFGYQATIEFDKTALRYLKNKSKTGDYLSGRPFFDQKVEGNTVTLISTAYVGQSKGDGTLATLVFEVIAVKASTLKITEVRLSNIKGQGFTPRVEHAEITEPEKIKEDVNGDGNINILDLVFVVSKFGKNDENDADINNDGTVNIQDLVLVAAKLGSTNAAPTLYSNLQGVFTTSDVQHWLSQARQLSLTDTRTRKGIHFLEQLLTALTPKQTLLLPNYPNPFNPETWIPYHLAKSADVTLNIYAANGKMVRTIALGIMPAGVYQSQSHAAYWDGKNTFGEPVASGVYFYTLIAGNFTATRKMLIMK